MINEEKINKILELRKEFLKVKDKILVIEKNNPQVFKKVKCWDYHKGKSYYVYFLKEGKNIRDLPAKELKEYEELTKRKKLIENQILDLVLGLSKEEERFLIFLI